MNTEQQNAPLNILCADDDTDDFIFLKEALKEFLRPEQLIIVHEGEQLMQLLTNETKKFTQFFFLDLN